jgi:acetylornithine deacetylase
MPTSEDGVDRALALAAAGRAASVEALRELVRVPSLTGEEGAAQTRVAAWLSELGAETHVAEPDVFACFERFPEVAQYPTHWQHDLVLPYADLPTAAALRASGLEGVLSYRGRPNVVGVVRGTGGGRSLLLNGHVDTVTVEPRGAWTRDPFGAEVADGLLFGRGASDMKGGLVAGLMALGYLRAAGVRLAGDVIVQSVVNEEHAGNGTLDLVRRGWRADAAIVLEPTENRVAVSHPGGLYWQVIVPGVPRSPGARWEGGRQVGVSAIEKLPAIVEALLALERDEHGRAAAAAGDPAERGRAPFALVIGKVAGGHYETVTAGEAVLRGGVYFAPGVGDVRDVMGRIREAVARAGERDPFLRAHPARLEFLHHDDATRQPADVPIAAHVGGVLARRGRDGGVRPGPFACDLRHLVNQAGIPSIIFGPGTIAQAHKPDEHIPVQEYLDCIEHLVDIIATWCGAPVAAASDRRKEPVS